MPFIAGLKAKDGYIFFANNITEGSRKNGAVVELSNYCGALILTSNGEQLQRLKKVINRCVSDEIKKMDDMSDGLVEKTVSFLKEEFQKDESYRTLPLTFLLLVVGVNRHQQGRLEHVYIRNRVAERKENEGVREYVTVFDIEAAVPAGNIFYGASDIIEYLVQRLPSESSLMNIVKILAPLSMPDFLNKEIRPLSDIEMASLSAEDGFKRINPEELASLCEKAKRADSLLIKGLSEFIVQKV